MKKFLYCAAVVALATACTQDDELANIPSSQVQGQGLTFNVTLADNNTVNTRGELFEENKTYPFFWYAEQDRIDVFGYNLLAATSRNVGYGSNSTGKGIVSDIGADGAWTLANSGTPISASEYKATQSEGHGKFTAVSDGDMLAFDGDKTATIIATYGDVAVTAAKSEVANGKPVAGSLKSLVLTTDAANGSNATQTVKNPNQVIAPMYSITSATPAEDYSSVGESANLSLVRPFPVLQFTTANVNKYADDFGPLKSVTLKTVGRNATDATKWDANVAGNSIVFDVNKAYTLTFGEGVPEGEWENNWAASANANIAKVTIASTENWNDANSVYMTVAPVLRSESEDHEEDMLVVTYDFENISFTLDGTKANAKEYEILTTKGNWTSYTADGRPNAVTFMSKDGVNALLDINNYDYLVVGKVNSTDKTLIINRGSVANVLTADKSKVIWPVGTADNSVNDGYKVANIKKVVVNCDITDEDFANLNKFTAATHIEMTAETSIPENGLASLTAVEKLILPEVTEVNEDFVSTNFNKLTELVLSSYPFDESINDRFFNSDTQKTLQYIDLASVEDFGPVYLGRRALIFQNYAKLDSVKVMENAALYAQQFSGCENLVKVIGSVDLQKNDADYAFMQAKKLKVINVTTTVIPDWAFKDAFALTDVLLDGKQVAPTVVGEYAFASAKALTYMDLSKVEGTLGQRAFRGSNLTGSAEGQDLKVGAKVIGASAFKETPLKFVHFWNAETLQEKVFEECALTQIKFNKVFKVEESDGDEWSTTNNYLFGTCSGTDLLVAEGQDFSGSRLTVGPKGEEVTFTFKAIRVEAPYDYER